MPYRLHIVQPGRDLGTELERGIAETDSTVLAFAVAYVSVYGATYIQRLSTRMGITEVRLVTDIRDSVTHPQALRIGLSGRWLMRAVNRPQGTFHPKVCVAGRGFSPEGLEPRLLVVGSSNLSKGGLSNNIECSMVHVSGRPIVQAPVLFSQLWEQGVDLDIRELDEYERRFVEQNRWRSPHDIEALGISDEPLEKLQGVGLRGAPPAIDGAFSATAANAVWVGLRTTTGGYRFQVEFPQRAAAVLRGMMIRSGQGENVQVICEDGSVRDMRFAFYENQMFRLNVPNDLPGVREARATRSGVALVERVENAPAPFRLTIVHRRDGIEALEQRSFVLGTWGRRKKQLS